MGSKEAAVLAAAATVFARNPTASLQEVANEAGVGRATLYRSFPTREDLIRALSDEAIGLSGEILTGALSAGRPALETLREVIDGLIPLGDKYHALLVLEPLSDSAWEERRPLWEKLVGRLRDDGVVAPDIPTAWALNALESLIFSAWESIHDGYVARRDAPDLVFRTFTRGIGSPRSR